MMPTLTQHAAPDAQSRLAPIATVAMLFWLFSYALFTSRVQLRGDEGVAALFTLRRLLTTAAGALIYAAVLRFAIFPVGRKAAHPLVLIAAVIPAAAAMVAIRVVVDPLVSQEPLPFSEHLRWVLVWAGYFGLWLIGFTAWRLHGERTERTSAPVGIVAARTWRPLEQSSRSGPSREALEDLIEAIADEAARLPEADRQALLSRLGATYAEADDPFGNADARRAVIARIARSVRAPQTVG